MNRLALFIVGSLTLLLTCPAQGQPAPTTLSAQGLSVIPAPREVQLTGQEVQLSEAWTLEADSAGASRIAVRTLVQGLKKEHGLRLRETAPGQVSSDVIRFSVDAGAVATGAEEAIARQGYALELTPEAIEVRGNSAVGLFYGVQTLLQLIEPARQGARLPAGHIEDWPSLRLRALHWDTKHHQDRVETLKRYLDWAARFKINMISFELEDKFSYPSHPVIGAPGAFTPDQLQEIVDYGLERHIQVVPNVQAPAHMAYVLKHPAFASLRADSSNYQACLCEEKTYDVIFSMYEDLIEATEGVDYFHVSTDEVYYAGICGKCERPYNVENRSRAWAGFVRRAHDFLAERDRRMLIWLEYPLLPKHVALLPPDVIDGVLGNGYFYGLDPPRPSFDLRQAYLEAERKRGISGLLYTSMQGGELLFPNYFSVGGHPGRLASAFETLSSDVPVHAIGTFGAAWDDAGLHNETFWLGWSAVAQYGWTRGTPSVEAHAAAFFDIYYGPDVTGMAEIYQGLQQQARFFEASWDEEPARDLKPSYGSSRGKDAHPRTSLTLPSPALPSLPELDFARTYDGAYEERVEKARQRATDNALLTSQLQENLLRATRNRYNLEVLLSLARFTGHHNQLIIGLREIEDRLAAARRAAQADAAEEAVDALVQAYRSAEQLVTDRQKTFAALQETWEKSRSPKGQAVGGKPFYHELDDLKDHWADRQADLSFMTAPEERVDLEGWRAQLAEITKAYARQHEVSLEAISLGTRQGSATP